MLAHPSSLRRARRGNYSVMMGVLIGIVIGFGAMSVDVSLMTVANLQNQATADAASHAALIGFARTGTTLGGRNAAQYLVSRNKVAMGHGTLDAVTFGTWTFGEAVPAFLPNTPLNQVNAAKAEVSRQNANSVRTLLGGLLGVPTFEVDSDAVAAQRRRAVMLVLDLSCSMMDGNESSTTSRVALLRQATTEFYDYMEERPQSGDLFGIATFALTASVEPTNPHPWSTVCNVGNPTGCADPWLPLIRVDPDNAANTATINTRIGGICDTVEGDFVCDATGAPKAQDSDIDSLTNPAPALLQGIEELGDLPDEYYKAILFMTDGQPTCGPNCATDAIAAATNAGARGIVIYGVTVTTGGNDPTFVDAVVAQGAEGGFNQLAATAADLPVMFAEVARRLPTVFTE